MDSDRYEQEFKKLCDATTPTTEVYNQGMEIIRISKKIETLKPIHMSSEKQMSAFIKSYNGERLPLPLLYKQLSIHLRISLSYTDAILELLLLQPKCGENKYLGLEHKIVRFSHKQKWILVELGILNQECNPHFMTIFTKRLNDLFAEKWKISKKDMKSDKKRIKDDLKSLQILFDSLNSE